MGDQNKEEFKKNLNHFQRNQLLNLTVLKSFLMLLNLLTWKTLLILVILHRVMNMMEILILPSARTMNLLFSQQGKQIFWLKVKPPAALYSIVIFFELNFIAILLSLAIIILFVLLLLLF